MCVWLGLGLHNTCFPTWAGPEMSTRGLTIKANVLSDWPVQQSATKQPVLYDQVTVMAAMGE